MIKVIAVALGIALSSGIASAQPAPTPPPVPTPGEPAPDEVPKTPKTDEKAGSNESLQHGGDQRPWAAGVPPEKQRIALDKFREGNVQLNDGLFANAAKLYREALVHWDHPAINYNLALALLNLDQPIEVYDSLEKAIKFGTAPLEKDKFEHAKEYMLLVANQIASVEVSCDKEGAKVSVDGKEVFTAPGKYASRVRIGKHTFFAEKQGYIARIKAPFIGPGEKFRIELKLYTAEDLTRYKRRWERTWVPWAVVGGGAVIAGVGGLLQLSAKSSYDDFDRSVEQCSMNNSGCTITPELQSVRDSGDSKRTASYVTYGIAGGTIAVGLAMAYLNRRQSYEIRPEELSEDDVTFAPIVEPGMAGASVQGRF